MEQLTHLEIFNVQITGPGIVQYFLNPTFQQQIKAALATGIHSTTSNNIDDVNNNNKPTGGSYIPSLSSLSSSSLATRTPQEQQELDDYAYNQWEDLLLYLVGSSDSAPAAPTELRDAPPPLDVASLLLSAGLYATDNATGVAAITNDGFKFLLMDTYSQLWTILRQYIAVAEASSSDELSSAISFLLQIGFQPYTSIDYKALKPSDKVIAAHLAQLGLLKARKHKTTTVQLAPTWLASTAAGGPATGRGLAADGFVIVETNYRVYAYTASPVRQAILKLFIKCEVLLPNLFVGTITRDSIMAALEFGIGAEQILGFLYNHAHTRVAKNVPVVPTVVSDQVRLWQREMKRLRSETGVVYKSFESGELYRRTAAFACKLGAILHRNDEDQILLVRAEAHDRVKGEIKSVKQELRL